MRGYVYLNALHENLPSISSKPIRSPFQELVGQYCQVEHPNTTIEESMRRVGWNTQGPDDDPWQ